MKHDEIVNVADTETTGFAPKTGDRIVEIGIVRMQGIHVIDEFHRIINPLMEIPKQATDIHGITDAMVIGKPTFEEVADDFLAFIGNDPLVIHNAPFDMGFLNEELQRAGKPRLRNEARDTLEMTRRKFPGSPATLDALAKRFKVTNLRDSADGRHGALIDARMLADIYIELAGGRQSSLTLQMTADTTEAPAAAVRKNRIVIAATDEEKQRHAAFLANNVKNPIWSIA